MRVPSVSSGDAYHLAHDFVRQGIVSARSYFVEERRQIKEQNRPRVAVLEMIVDYLGRKHSALINQLEPLLTQSGSSTTAYSSLSFALLFALVGYALSRTSIAPFHLGWSGEFFSVGLSLLLPYAVHRIISLFSLQKHIRSALEVALFLSAIATMVAFAGIRADVFRRDITGGPAVIFDTVGASFSSPDNSSDKVANLLRWAWVSAAIGFELACGLCWADSAKSTRGDKFNLIKKLEKELFQVEAHYLAALTELQNLLSQPAQTYAGNWADFRRGMSDALAKFDDMAGRTGRIVGVVLVGLIAVHTAMGADTVHVIAGLDLSATEKATGFGKTEFDENKLTVTQLLARLPAGARVSVVGITHQTLANPLLLLSAELSDDSGYFGSRLQRGRRDLVSEWARRTADLKPTAPHTDVVGLFALASDIFSHSIAERRILVILSDMREEQPGVLNLEKPEVIDVARSLKQVEKRGLVPKLSGVQVYVLGAGAHGEGKGPEYWVSLKAFWTEYVRRSGATLQAFSTTRNPEVLREITTLPQKDARLR